MQNGKIKVYALHIGASKIPYGQFYGGGEGWVGLSGAIKFLKDKSHYIMAPIYTYLVDHPTAGLILVDTGINWKQANEHHEYYNGPLLHATLDDDEYSLLHEQELSVHLKQLGYRAEDIKTVIATHLHEDHIGGLPEVAHATMLVTREEWESKAIGIFPYKNSTSLKWARKAGFGEPLFIEFTPGPFHGFDKSQDLLGDGSIIIVPTPGHSAGHVSVLIQMDCCQLLCVGDTLYSLRHLALDQVRPIALGKKVWVQQADSIRRIADLQRMLPNTVIAPAHDNTAYARDYLEPFLADGVLSANELREIQQYQARLFSDNGRLPNESLPHYISPKSKEGVGSVTEPKL